MSSAYNKLLKKLNQPAPSARGAATTQPAIDPKILALQNKFSAVLKPQEDDIPTYSDDDDNDDEEDIDEDDDMMGDFDDEDDYNDYEQFADEDQEDDDANPLSKYVNPPEPGQWDDVNEEEVGDEDDEVNVFEYDWDIERDQSDSELDDNDGDDEQQQNGDDYDNEGLDQEGARQKSDQGKKKHRRLDDDDAKATTLQSFYDQYFNTTLTRAQLKQLETLSPFLPIKSGQVGLTLKSSLEVDESKSVSILKQNKLNPLYNNNNDNDQDEDDITSGTKQRDFILVKNVIPLVGSMLDPINGMNSKKFDPESVDDALLTSAQRGAAEFQVYSDRQSLNLPPLPPFPPSDGKYPVDEQGEPVIFTKPNMTTAATPAVSKKQQVLNKLLGKKGKQQSTNTTDAPTTQYDTRRAQTFANLSYKQRLGNHLAENYLLTATSYENMRNQYMQYTPQAQYEFMMALQETLMSKSAFKLNSTNYTTPKYTPNSYQNDVQTFYSNLLSLYTDTLLVPPTHAPLKAVEWCSYRDSYLIHILNHVLTHRDRIIAHNESLYRRDARNKEINFIKSLSRIRDKDERFKALEERCNELYALLDDETKSAHARQEAQARLAVLTHSNKTRIQIQQFEQQYNEQKKLQKQTATKKNAATTPGGVKGKRTLGPLVTNNDQDDGEDDDALSEQVSHKATTNSPFDHQELKYRDQGYTRPTALVLLPTRAHAYTAVTRLLQLMPPQQTKKLINLERFHEEYGDVDGDYNPHHAKSLDYQLTFQGNSDDCFRIGLQLTNNGVKLFSSLYSSDIIFASPLGLKLIVGNEGSDPHERRADFLTSIEILTIDNLELIAQQNIDHLVDVLNVMNGLPTKTASVDFSRVRQYFLNGHARFYRQNIWLSSVLTPHLQHLFGQYCENKNGRIRLRPAEYTPVTPYINHPRNTIRQIVYRIDLSANITTQQTLTAKQMKKMNDTVYEKKLNMWFHDLWPRMKDWYQHEGNTVIFVPSSYDFVRIRNIMKQKYIDYCIFSEYSDQRMIDSYRSRIRDGKAKFILVSERYWVFNRSLLHGIHHIVWYGVPTMPEVYVDFLNFIKPPARGGSASVGAVGQQQQQQGLISSNVSLKTSAFSSLAKKQPTSFLIYSLQDVMALERIVGTEFAREMLTSGDNMHIIQ